MRQSTFIFFLVFSFSVFGAFAALAKHDYGFVILSIGCLLFSIAFLIEIFRTWRSPATPLHRAVLVAELLSLAFISLLFFSKIFLFLFIGINTLYFVVVSILIITTLLRITIGAKFSDPDKESNITRISIFSSLLLFLVADGYSKLFYHEALWLLLAGLLVAFVSLSLAVLRKQINIRENRPIWLLFGYMLFACYTLMVEYRQTDEVSFRRLPSQYVKLFYDAESGREQPVNGKYQYQIYLEGRDKFIGKYKADN